MHMPDQDPVFAEPWQAQAFALTLTLRQRGMFTWPEWAATLADEIAKARARGDRDLGDTYYEHWLAALERLVAEKGASDSGELERVRMAWDRAAQRTPHGKAIELSETDLR